MYNLFYVFNLSMVAAYTYPSLSYIIGTLKYKWAIFDVLEIKAIY